MRLKKDFLKRIEFENRIFFSFGIVIIVVLLSYTIFIELPLTAEIPFLLLGIKFQYYSSMGYTAALLAVIAGSVIRMWAGSVLTSSRMMSFKVRPEKLITYGPYNIVRNPIYLADFIALSGLTFILPVSGILMPLMFLLHYERIIRYEEEHLLCSVKNEYREYFQKVPRLIPRRINCVNKSEAGNFRINYDGFRHNALYLFFIPGIIISALTNNVIYTYLIGIPAVIEWGYIHTKIGRTKETRRSKVFESVLYAQCWEDVSLDREAFNINKDDVVFTITSGGCNALSFLLDDPLKVIALDLNEKQNFLLELKIACFRCLTYTELLEFFGIRENTLRDKLFAKVQHCLSKGALEYWSNNQNLIRKGIIHAGRYEKYLKFLRIILHFIQGKELINKLFLAENIEERIKLYDDKWNNYKWKIFIRVFLSRGFISLLFDKAFFRYIRDNFSFGRNFEKKIKYAITRLPIKDNFFLSYILLGKYFSEEHLPYYLSKNNHQIIRERLSRIKIITQDCESYFRTLGDSSISKFNFTNIFEWMPDDAYENLLKETIRVARNNAVMTYRNLLVPREHPEMLGSNIHSMKDIAETLHTKDLSFIYDRYIVEEITGKLK